MPPSTRTDPFTAMNFRVEIDGIAASDFLEVCGIEAAAVVVDSRNGSDTLGTPRKLPGETTFANITLKRGLTSDLSLWNWMRETLDGKVSRRNMSIVLLNDAKEDVLRFNFINAWPAKWEGPHLNGESNDVAIETLEIAHEGLSLAA